MKLALIVAVVFMTIWAIFNAFLLGYVPVEFVPQKLTSLKSPESIASLGDSAAIIDSLFSSLALALGIIAVLMQGRELRASTNAQTEQAVALSDQIKQQQESNRLGAYTARLQFLLTASDRMDYKITSLVNEANSNSDPLEKAEKWKLIKNLRNKEVSYRNEAEGIDDAIKSLLNKI